MFFFFVGVVSALDNPTTAAVVRLRELYKSGSAAEVAAFELEHPLAAVQATIHARATDLNAEEYERWRWAKMGEPDARVSEAAEMLRRSGEPWKLYAGAVAELGYWTLRGSTAAESVLLEHLSERDEGDWVQREIDATLRKAWATPERIDVSHALDEARGKLVAGNAMAALERYENAQTLAPEWPEVWRRTAQVFDKALGMREEARSAYETAMNLNPRNYVVIVDFGLFLKNIASDDGEWSTVRSVLEEAVRLNPALLATQPAVREALRC